MIEIGNTSIIVNFIDRDTVYEFTDTAYFFVFTLFCTSDACINILYIFHIYTLDKIANAPLLNLMLK